MAGEPIITVVGNLTEAPKLEYTRSGKPVANFNVASTPRKRNAQTGEMEDGEAMYIRCAVWDDYAENVAESLVKGTRVIVTGRLRVNRFTREDGSQGMSLEMSVDEVGPCLRFATAQVTKASRGGGYGGNGSQGYSQGGGQGRASYDAPAGGSAYDPWAQNASGGSSFDDNPPF